MEISLLQYKTLKKKKLQKNENTWVYCKNNIIEVGWPGDKNDTQISQLHEN